MFGSLLSLLSLTGRFAQPPAQDSAQRCAELAQTDIQNAHSVTTLYLAANASYRVPASCGSGLADNLLAQTSVNVCVVNVVYNTSQSSATRIEAWLPDTDAWYGRILGTGGAGLGGCVDYDNLKWGPTLHFATFGHDGGHDGASGAAFARSDQIVVDWAQRAQHVAADTTKLLVHAYYGRAHDRTYYIGCSNGGRQGLRSVQDYPEDFDGVLVGAPAINSVHMLGQGNILNLASRKLNGSDWGLVRAEVLRQCDGLDGLHDGIVSDPDACQFLPEVLLCSGEKQSDCLSAEQVEAVRVIHSPLYGEGGQLFFPRFDPGAVVDTMFFPAIFGLSYYPFGLEWWRYVVYNDSTWVPSPDFGLKEIADGDRRDEQLPVRSFNPDISAFHKRGGKVLTYHGTRDILIPSGLSLWYYQMVQRSLSLPPSKMDQFYRLFLVPGMNHCYAGPGAWQFGQIGFASWSNSSDSNALLALVDWVETGKGPETLRGSRDNATASTTPKTRLHCKYPARSVWNPDLEDWTCLEFP